MWAGQWDERDGDELNLNRLLMCPYVARVRGRVNLLRFPHTEGTSVGVTDD